MGGGRGCGGPPSRSGYAAMTISGMVRPSTGAMRSIDLMVGRCSSLSQRSTTDGSVPTARAKWVGVGNPASWIASFR
nr:hypothetical protein GCM10020092_089600 [Actinoplanes digitatis]